MKKILSLTEMLEKTNAKNGLVYKKIEIMKKARVAFKGEVVVTTINGVVETTNTANEGDMIITGLVGEEYIIPSIKFEKLYNKIEDGLYVTKPDSIKAIQVTEEIHFLAPWGSEMIALPGDYIAYRSDSDAYRIEKGEFEKTYALA